MCGIKESPAQLCGNTRGVGSHIPTPKAPPAPHKGMMFLCYVTATLRWEQNPSKFSTVETTSVILQLGKKQGYSQLIEKQGMDLKDFGHPVIVPPLLGTATQCPDQPFSHARWHKEKELSFKPPPAFARGAPQSRIMMMGLGKKKKKNS